jgi:hypothetical protein
VLTGTVEQQLTKNSMYGSGYIFSKKFFTGWVIVSLLWAFFSFFSVSIYPIIEGRHLLIAVLGSLFGRGDQNVGKALDHHRHEDALASSDSTSEKGTLAECETSGSMPQT